MPNKTKPRVGRPRTRPHGAAEAKLAVPISADERAAINAAAADAGMSAAQWMRRELLRAAGFRGGAIVS